MTWYEALAALIIVVVVTLILSGCTFAEYDAATNKVTYIRILSDNTLSGLQVNPKTGDVKLDSSQSTVRDELLLEAIRKIP